MNRAQCPYCYTENTSYDHEYHCLGCGRTYYDTMYGGYSSYDIKENGKIISNIIIIIIVLYILFSTGLWEPVGDIIVAIISAIAG